MVFSDSCGAEIHRCSGSPLDQYDLRQCFAKRYAWDLQTVGIEIVREVSEGLELSGFRPRTSKKQSPGPVNLTTKGDETERKETSDGMSGLERRREAESSGLFVQFVNKIRDRTK